MKSKLFHWMLIMLIFFFFTVPSAVTAYDTSLKSGLDIRSSSEDSTLEPELKGSSGGIKSSGSKSTKIKTDLDDEDDADGDNSLWWIVIIIIVGIVIAIAAWYFFLRR